MTDQEARDMFRDLFTMFPGIHNWLERVDDPEATYQAWRTMMGRVHPDDGKALLDQIRTGEAADYPTGTEPDRWPVWIVQKARELSGERWERKESARIQAQARGGIDQDRLVNFLARKVHDREDPNQAAKAVRIRDPHYQCDICRDTGAVEVWALIVHHRLATAKPIDRLKTETAACTCDRGEGLRTSNKRWSGAAVYDPDKFCRVTAPGWEDLADLAKWMEDRGAMVPDPIPGGRLVELAAEAASY